MTKRVYNNIYDLAHAFFYVTDGEERRTASASFKGEKFYSYYTCVGFIYIGKEKTVLFTSHDNMTPTTGKHLRALESASPFEVVRVPFQYGEHLSFMDAAAVVKWLSARFEEQIRYEKEQKRTYSRAGDREHAQSLASRAQAFQNVTGEKIKGLTAFEAYLSKALSADAIKAAAKKARERAAKKAAATKKAVAKFKKGMAKTPYLQLIEEHIFNYKPWQATEEQKRERTLFVDAQGVKNPAFIRINAENQTLVTSLHVTVKIKDAILLLKAWRHGHNIMGQKVDIYTVLANNDKYVKIGCHNIPRANVQALADALL